MSWIFDNQKLGELLSDKRTFEKLGLRDVAQQSGLSPSTLSRIETGKLPDLESFLLLANWLEVRPEVFFYNPLETDQDKLGQQLTDFQKISTLLHNLGITPERVLAIQTLIEAVIPPVMPPIASATNDKTPKKAEKVESHNVEGF